MYSAVSDNYCKWYGRRLESSCVTDCLHVHDRGWDLEAEILANSRMLNGIPRDSDKCNVDVQPRLLGERIQLPHERPPNGAICRIRDQQHTRPSVKQSTEYCLTVGCPRSANPSHSAAGWATCNGHRTTHENCRGGSHSPSLVTAKQHSDTDRVSRPKVDRISDHDCWRGLEVKLGCISSVITDPPGCPVI